MRAVSVHPDAIVVTSLLWQTTATAIRSGEEAMLVDSPYFPEELELLPTLLEPVPGHLGLGEGELELHPVEGHTSDGIAVLARWCGVLVCGDYLSSVEIPMISRGGSLGAYRAALARLAALLEVTETAVPGHGAPQSRDGALRILDEDLAYLDALERGEGRVSLPQGRDSPRQRQVHAHNVELLEG
jgi:glyoxylase-like metal-dependent hydrolase (beta-lactamase superfamily II)